MRSRVDFYTLCPECDARVTLTLAARLQANRLGTSCRCDCGHDWTCISEWIYRNEPDAIAAAPMSSQPTHPEAMSPPRPYLLPTYQPPLPVAVPQAFDVPAPTQAPQATEPHGQPHVPAPHAFSPANSDVPRQKADPNSR